MQKYVLSLFILTWMLSCNVSNNQSVQVISSAKEIPEKIQERIQRYDQKIIRSLKEENALSIDSISSAFFKKETDIKSLASMMPQISTLLKGLTPIQKDHIYITTNPSALTSSKNTVLKGSDDYNFELPINSEQMYISSYLFNSKSDGYMMTLIYSLHKNQWFLDRINLGSYSFYGKNALDFYNKGIEHMEQGHLIDAFIALEVSSNLLQPSSGNLNYLKSDDISQTLQFVSKSINEKYNFPFTLQVGTSNIEIFRIYSQRVGKDGFFPVIDYKSTFDISDTTALQLENELLHDSIEKVFPGILKNKSWLFYGSYNTIPSSEVQTPKHSFAHQLDSLLTGCRKHNDLIKIK